MLTGQQIAAARKSKGMTQTELANALGVSTEAVSKWEKDAYTPSPEHVQQLHSVLGLAFADLDSREARLFHERNMSSFLKGKFSSGDFPEASKALAFAKEMHKGQFRKPEDLKIPYIIHPLTMTCHALAMNLEDDVLLAALLLHDVSEDCGVPPEDLPVCPEVQEIVALVTKQRPAFSESGYYRAISHNPKACLVKCIDRCNNLSSLAAGFSDERIQDYIEETEKYYPTLLRIIKEQPEYNNAAWLLSYQIRSLAQMARRIP